MGLHVDMTAHFRPRRSVKPKFHGIENATRKSRVSGVSTRIWLGFDEEATRKQLSWN